MTPTRQLPHTDRLSVITAVIILAYALTRVLDLPSRAIHTTLFGSDLGFDLNGQVLMLVVVAGLISAGSDTLARSHPRLAQQSNRSTGIHLTLPGASAPLLGATRNRLPNGL